MSAEKACLCVLSACFLCATFSVSAQTLCGRTAVPLHGRMEPLKDSYPINSLVKFFCNPGTYLAGHSETTCQQNGVWSHQTPKCLGSPRCPHEGVLVSNGICMQIVQEMRNWKEAKWSCNDGRKGKFLSISSNWTLTQLTMKILNNTQGEFWVDGKAVKRWFWTSGKELTYFNWAPNEPNDVGSKEEYIMLWYGQKGNAGYKWNDEHGDTREQHGVLSKFICQFPNDSSEACTKRCQNDIKKCVFYNDNCYVLNGHDDDQLCTITTCSALGNSWFSSADACEKQDGFLAEINDENTHNKIVAVIKSEKKYFGSYWIGSKWNRTAPPRGQWGTGQLIDDRLWAHRTTKTSAGNEFCVYISATTRRLHLDICNTHRHYICKYDSIPYEVDGCGQPPIPIHSQVQSNKQRFPMGGQVSYACKKGFRIANDNATTKECHSDGNWVGEDIRCVATSPSTKTMQLSTTSDESTTTDTGTIQTASTQNAETMSTETTNSSSTSTSPSTTTTTSTPATTATATRSTTAIRRDTTKAEIQSSTNSEMQYTSSLTSRLDSSPAPSSGKWTTGNYTFSYTTGSTLSRDTRFVTINSLQTTVRQKTAEIPEQGPFTKDYHVTTAVQQTTNGATWNIGAQQQNDTYIWIIVATGILLFTVIIVFIAIVSAKRRKHLAPPLNDENIYETTDNPLYNYGADASVKLPGPGHIVSYKGKRPFINSSLKQISYDDEKRAEAEHSEYEMSIVNNYNDSGNAVGRDAITQREGQGTGNNNQFPPNDDDYEIPQDVHGYLADRRYSESADVQKTRDQMCDSLCHSGQYLIKPSESEYDQVTFCDNQVAWRSLTK